MSNNGETGFREFGAALADYIFHPDYEKGRWSVSFPAQGDYLGARKICSNKSTAQAWANYLVRHGFRFIRLSRVDPLPGFPRRLSEY